MTHPRLADLFREPPEIWGLRGDPWLWDALALELADARWPHNGQAFEALLAHRYQSLVGMALSAGDSVYVAAFAHGGMSSGHICPSFWSDTALPLLLARFHRANAPH